MDEEITLEAKAVGTSVADVVLGVDGTGDETVAAVARAVIVDHLLHSKQRHRKQMVV